MVFTNGKISARQMQSLIILWIFSSALIGMPSAAVYNIYSVLIGAGLVLAECLLICYAEKRLNGNEKYHRLTAMLAGISMIIYAGINIKLLCGAVSIFLLPNTPAWIIALVFALAALYMAVLGSQAVGRSAELFLIIVGVNAVISAVLCLSDAGEGLLTSAFSITNQNVLLNGLKCACMFGGAQALYVLLPYTDGEEKTKKAVYAVLISVVAVVFFTYTAVSKFGINDTAARVYPALNIMDTVSLPFIFGDKQDVFMLRMWMFAVFAAVGFGVFSCGRVFSRSKTAYPHTIISAVIALAVSFIPQDINGAVQMLYTAGEISLIVFGVILPAISLTIGTKGGSRE